MANSVQRHENRKMKFIYNFYLRKLFKCQLHQMNIINLVSNYF